jgi:hypothetical protein
MGKPYALIGHVRFDKGEAMKMASLLYLRPKHQVDFGYPLRNVTLKLTQQVTSIQK